MIYCIGDSHAAAFSGSKTMIDVYPEIIYNGQFRAIRLGPCTAHNMYKRVDEIEGVLLRSGFNKSKDQAIICAGEIDCRWHMPRIISQQKRQIIRVVEDTARNFVGFIYDLEKRGINVWTYSPPGSTWIEPTDNPNCPVHSDEQTRNLITKWYDEKVVSIKKFYNLKSKHLDTKDILIDNDLRTVQHYYGDHLHLHSPRIIHILEERARKLLND